MRSGADLGSREPAQELLASFCYSDFLSVRAHQALSAACTVALCAALAGCAAPSPPLPPSLALPTPVTDLKAVRKGDKVLLTWTQPWQTTDGDGIRFPGPTRICRSLPDVTGTFKMTECGTPAVEVASSQVEITNQKAATNAPAHTSAEYADVLPASLMDPKAFVTYAIESLNTSYRGAGISNSVRVSGAPTEPPPSDLQAQLTASGVVLTWSGPLLSIVSHVKGVPYHSYRVYRNPADSTQRTLVGESIMGAATQMRLVDETLTWEKTYEYRVVVMTNVGLTDLHPCSGPAPGSVLSGDLADCAEQVEVEGADSAPVTVIAHDVFPPAVPTGLQAVFSGEGQKPFIDLTWNAGTGADLAGYNVYRREGGAQPVKINTDVVKAPAFRDTSVAAGQTYFYSVAAVDVRANESVRSEEASERVP